jgi:chaperonin cofactor prefoldin
MYYLTMPYPRTQAIVKPYLDIIQEMYFEFQNMYKNILSIEEKHKEYDTRLKKLEEGLIELELKSSAKNTTVYVNETSDSLFKIKLF